MSEYDFIVKILLLGPQKSGKSCTLLRFADDAYTEDYISTIGVDFKIKIVEEMEKKVKFQIWDTAGQERFRIITASYYRGTHVFVLFFALDDHQQFDSLPDFIQSIGEYGSPDTPICLVGSKSDLERAVSNEEI